MLGMKSLHLMVVVGVVTAIPTDSLSRLGLELDEAKEDFEAYIVHKGGESRLTVINKEGEHTVRFNEGFVVEKPENESVCLVRALAEGPLKDDDCIEKVPLRTQDVPDSVLEECGSRQIFAVESCIQDPEKEEMMEEELLEEGRENQKKEEQEMKGGEDILEEQELLEEEETGEHQQQTLPDKEDVLPDEGENEEEEGLLEQDEDDEETKREEEEKGLGGGYDIFGKRSANLNLFPEQIVKRAAAYNSYDGLFHEPVDKRSVQLNALDDRFTGKLDKRALKLGSFEDAVPGKIDDRVVDKRINKRDAKLGLF